MAATFEISDCTASLIDPRRPFKTSEDGLDDATGPESVEVRDGCSDTVEAGAADVEDNDDADTDEDDGDDTDAGADTDEGGGGAAAAAAAALGWEMT